MSTATARAVQLLELLHDGTRLTAPELARELGVTVRTVRRDIEQLRELGYPLGADRGRVGGYRLGPNATLPGVRFSTAEAVTCVLALEAWPHDEPARSSGLAKFAEVLPSRLGWTVEAVRSGITTLDVDGAFRAPDIPVAAEVIAELAAARHAGERVAFLIDGSARRVEPLAVTRAVRRWYLVGFDLDDEAWRLFPMDELDAPRRTGIPVAARRPAPCHDLDAWVLAQVSEEWQRVRCVVHADAPAEQVLRGIAPAWGSVEEDPAGGCIIRCGADSYDVIARWLLMLGCRLRVIEPDELRAAFGRAAAQARAAAS